MRFRLFVMDMSCAQIFLRRHSRHFSVSLPVQTSHLSNYLRLYYPHCSQSRSQSFDLQHHMTRFCLRLEGSCTCEKMVVHEVQVGGTLQPQGIESPSPGTECHSVLFYTSNDTKRSNTLRAIIDWTIPITKLSRSGAARYSRKIIRLLN